MQYLYGECYTANIWGTLLHIILYVSITHVRYTTFVGCDSHPNLMKLDPARMEHMAHFAILQLLFLSSVASAAPLWDSSFLRQSTPPDCWGRGGGRGEGVREE